MLTVFGSINVDVVLRVPRIALPGETVLGQRVAETPGGKGANQAVAAARVAREGLRVEMIGAIGDDDHGRLARNALVSAGVSPVLSVDPEAPTGAAIIVVDDNGENAITVIPGANGSLSSGALSQSSMLADVLLCQGEVSLATTFAAIERYKQANPRGRAILNLAPAPNVTTWDPKLALGNIDFLIVNASEGSAVEAVLGKSLASFAAESGVVVVVTQGANGALVYGGADEDLKVPTIEVQPVDTTGAGDAFCGVFAAMLCEGTDIEAATQLACRAGALACCAIGAQSAMPSRSVLFATDSSRG